VKLTYEIQDKPRGLAEAFIIGENFIDEDNVTLILGDNIFEDDFTEDIRSFQKGAKIFAKKVKDPERFGVVEINNKAEVLSIEEKPLKPKSNLAITGLYIYDHRVIDVAKKLKPSARGELEIVDLHNWYLARHELEVSLVHGAWIDAGTFDSLLEAQSLARDRLQSKLII
jgi:glucose-1-phosphate thymidylyltransferase